MKPLAPDEKSSTVMVYTQTMLARGEIVLKENVRVSIWLRTQGAPTFIHLIKPQVVVFGGSPPKTYAYEEIYIPTEQALAFHLVPPAVEALDYDASEANRKMQNVNLLLGSFTLKGKMRVSSAAEFSSSLEVMKASWVSVYDAEIANPYLTQFSVNVPMLLVSPNKVAIGVV
ncbi:MAG: hypothetical protein IT311_12230 [Anaerolineales bacterium]|nr:hypothetical protein [Anaerolineales bacterium]MCZ2122633.1 hypothetical protein [Anaerolineales bacterium]